jgi:glycosyltransferase involved in cell wall biosynthesis
VPLSFAADRFDEVRRTGANGEKIYSLWDAYPHADLVTYPSLLEGFGNALLETFYFQRPVVVNNYDVYATDIGPLGFDVLLLQDGVTEENVRATRALLDDRARQAQMGATNLALAQAHFSYAVLRRELPRLLAAAGAL